MLIPSALLNYQMNERKCLIREIDVLNHAALDALWRRPFFSIGRQ